MIDHFFDIRNFGADPNNADNTVTIQSTINACQTAGGGTVYVPPGEFLLESVLITDNVTLLGEGAYCSFLKSLDSENDVVMLSGVGNRIANLGFKSQVQRTGGAYVRFLPSSSGSSIDHFLMEGAYIGVHTQGFATLYVEHGAIRFSSTHPGGAGVLVDGGQDHYINHLTMNNEPEQQPTSGIHIQATGNVNIADVDIIHCGIDLLITGGFAVYVRDSYFDTAGIGIHLKALSPIQRCHFIGCWTAGHTGHGVLLDGSSPSSIDSIDLIGHHSFANNGDGIHTGKGNHVKIQSSTCAQNVSAVGVGALARHVQILGNRFGTTELPGNAYGIFLVEGCDYVIISDNDLTGNVEAALAGTAPHLIWCGNLV